MNEIVTSIEQSKRHDIRQPSITLTPIQGLPGIYVDCEAMKAYVNRRGMLHELSIRQPFSKISFRTNGKNYCTTIYRLIWAAQHDIDYNKIPSNYCFSFADGEIKVMERADIARKSAETRRKENQINVAKAQEELDLIKGYNLDHRKTKSLILLVTAYRPIVTAWMKYNFGLCDERAELYAEQAEALLMQRIKEGNATYGFLSFLKKNASILFRYDKSRRIEYYENGRPKPINANYM